MRGGKKGKTKPDKEWERGKKNPQKDGGTCPNSWGKP